MNAELVVQILLGIITVGGSYFAVSARLRAERDKRAAETTNLDADTAATLTRSAGDWVKQQDERINALATKVERRDAHIDTLETRVAELEDEGRRYREWARILNTQVLELGGDPYPFTKVT